MSDAPAAGERRQHNRIPSLSIPAVLLFESHDLGLVRLTEISKGGAFIAVDSPVLPPGTWIELRFMVRNGADPLTLSATVARVVQPGGGQRAGYGVQFSEPPEDVIDRLLRISTESGAGVLRKEKPAQHGPHVVMPAPTPRAAPPPQVVPGGEPAKIDLPVTVLLIEDDVALGRAVARILAGAMLGVRHEVTGVAGYTAFREMRDELRMIIVDGLLPDMSGVDLIARIRFARGDMPILAMSGIIRTKSGQRAFLESGADGFLEKPFGPPEITKAVLGMLGKKHVARKKSEIRHSDPP